MKFKIKFPKWLEKKKKPRRISKFSMISKSPYETYESQKGWFDNMDEKDITGILFVGASSIVTGWMFHAIGMSFFAGALPGLFIGIFFAFYNKFIVEGEL